MPFEDAMAAKVQRSMEIMQTGICHYEGNIRQFLFDDKGSVLIACFGLPPSHEDDPVRCLNLQDFSLILRRAIKTALKIHKELKSELNVDNSIGVTTGRVFCGTVGSEERREYAVVGDTVNLSARLMASAKGKNSGKSLLTVLGRILCDHVTYTGAYTRIKFNPLPSIMVKGKKKPIRIYEPVEDDNMVVKEKKLKRGKYVAALAQQALTRQRYQESRRQR